MSNVYFYHLTHNKVYETTTLTYGVSGTFTPKTAYNGTGAYEEFLCWVNDTISDDPSVSIKAFNLI